ncbi:purine-cytosine permease family protein [Alkalicoccus chagannorensis]|uniref:purine-cytosine permease family protein n=1 Tax=Alkalicoccus chagannorensis TaxID=427072 RepID=UPI000412DC12|nr:cytosine permease [Alkalicoccus chagannorensis]
MTTRGWEQFGLQPVPEDRKTSTAWDFMRMQTVINVNAGNMLVPALAVLEGGLSFLQAVWVTLLGSAAAYIFVSLLSLAGSRQGIPGQFALRSMLGRMGAVLFASPLRTVTSLYWFGVQALGGAYFLHTFLTRAGASIPFPLLSFLLALLMVITALVGFEAMKRFSAYFMPVLALGTVAMFFVFFYSGTAAEVTAAGSPDPAWHVMVFFASLAFVQYVSGVTSSSDLARYAVSPAQGFWGLFAGNVTGYFLTAVLGAWTAAAAGDWNAFLITAEMNIHPLLTGVIASAAVGSMFIINVNNAYTGGYSLLNSVPALGRMRAACLFGAAAIAVSLMPQLVEEAESFISGLGTLVIPLTAVVCAEFLIRHKTWLQPADRAWNFAACASIGTGAVVYMLLPQQAAPGFTVFFLSFVMQAGWIIFRQKENRIQQQFNQKEG